MFLSDSPFFAYWLLWNFNRNRVVKQEFFVDGGGEKIERLPLWIPKAKL